jgi:ABC-type polysaccharide/polyol phosphate export permease
VVKLIFQPVFWWWMLWAVPGVVCFAIVVTLISASLAYLNARFRDVQPAVSALMQIMFYVTPVIYMPQQLAESGHAFVYLYNPLFHLINIVRGPMLGHTRTLGISWAVSGMIVVALMVILLLVIRRYDRRIVYYL